MASRKHALAKLPHRVVVDELLFVRGIAQGEAVAVVGDAEVAIGALDKLHDGGELFLDLIGRAEDVRIVQGHAAHAAQPAQRSRKLVAIHGAEFGEAHGQIAIAAALGLVDEDVVRAVHGPQHHALVLEIHGRKHAVLVVGPVAGAHVEIDLGEVGCADVLVAQAPLEIEDVLLEQTADGGALGQPEWQACSDFLADGEELELFAEAAVIAALGVFEAREIVVEILLREEGGAVDALKLRVLFIAEPVGAGDGHGLEGADAACGWNMRPAAEVDELAVAIEADVGAGLGEPGDEVRLHEVAGVAEFFEDFFAGLVDVLEFFVPRDDFGHLTFDSGEVFGREGRLAIEVVEEAGVGGGTVAELGLRKELQYRRGQHVRRRMTDNL